MGMGLSLLCEEYGPDGRWCQAARRRGRGESVGAEPRPALSGWLKGWGFRLMRLEFLAEFHARHPGRGSVPVFSADEARGPR